MLRRIGAVVLGLIAAWLPIALVEAFTHHLYPPPPGLNMHARTDVFRYVGTLPTPAFILVLGGWLVGTFLGTWLAAKIARSAIPAYILGAILLAAGIFNSIAIPQPLWFSIASFAIYIGGTAAGARVGAPRTA